MLSVLYFFLLVLCAGPTCCFIVFFFYAFYVVLDSAPAPAGFVVDFYSVEWGNFGWLNTGPGPRIV